MTNKQKRFCDEYLIDCNAAQAAIRAGYSGKTARTIGQKLLTIVDIKTYIDEKLTKLSSVKIANAEEVMIYLTTVLRGESRATVIADEKGKPKLIEKPPDEKERLKAAELLAKRYGILTEKLNVTIEPVTIVDDLRE